MKTKQGHTISIGKPGPVGERALYYNSDDGHAVVVGYIYASSPISPATFAAAPDLLAVVIAAEKWVMLNVIGQSVPWLDDATTAIVKAQGRTK